MLIMLKDKVAFRSGKKTNSKLRARVGSGTPRELVNSKVASTVADILALAQGALVWQTADAATLPMPCIANTCTATHGGGPVHPGFVTAGSATATQVGNTLTINQSSQSAILNCQSFNASPDGTAVFNQPANTSVALNRIYQQNPSSIFGSVSANGS